MTDNYPKYLFLADAISQQERSEEQILNMAVDGEIDIYALFCPEEIETGRFNLNRSTHWFNGSADCAQPLPIEAVRLIQLNPGLFEQEGYGSGLYEKIELLPHHTAILLKKISIYIKYGWLSDGKAFNVTRPEKGIKITRDGVMVRTPFPCLSTSETAPIILPFTGQQDINSKNEEAIVKEKMLETLANNKQSNNDGAALTKDSEDIGDEGEKFLKDVQEEYNDFLLSEIGKDINPEYHHLIEPITKELNNLPPRKFTSLKSTRKIQDDILIIGSNQNDVEAILHLITGLLRKVRMHGEYDTEICDRNIAKRLNLEKYHEKSHSKYLILEHLEHFPSDDDGLLTTITKNWCVVGTISSESDRLSYFQNSFIGMQIDADNKQLILPDEFKQTDSIENCFEVKLATQEKHVSLPCIEESDSYITGQIDLCGSFGLGDKSFNAVVRRVKYAGMEFEREIPGDKNSSPKLKASDIIIIKNHWKKRSPN